jgi:TolB-like protein
MKQITNTLLGLISVTSFLLLSGATPTAADETPEAASVNAAPNTLAILPFENNSITDREQYAPLSKGLSAMLTTDLSQSDTSLKLIERGKILSLLKEIALSQAGGVDESTVVMSGATKPLKSIVNAWTPTVAANVTKKVKNFTFIGASRGWRE